MCPSILERSLVLSPTTRRRKMDSNDCSSTVPDDGNGAITRDESWLPPEVLAQIFVMLDTKDKVRCSSVCRNWKDASYRKSVWRDIIFQWWPHMMVNNPTIRDSLKLRKMQNVVLTITKEDGDVDFKEVIQDMFATVPDWKLTELIITHNSRITGEDIRSVAHHFPDLVRLEIGKQCTGVVLEPSFLWFITISFKKLTHISLGNCATIGTNELYSLIGHYYDNDGTCRFPPYERLELSPCVEFCDVTMKSLLLLQPYLKCLRLRDFVKMSDNGLRYIFKLPLLQELTIHGKSLISQRAYDYYVANSRVKKLWIDGFSNLQEFNNRPPYMGTYVKFS